jgi:hypothetical protein
MPKPTPGATEWTLASSGGSSTTETASGIAITNLRCETAGSNGTADPLVREIGLDHAAAIARGDRR